MTCGPTRPTGYFYFAEYAHAGAFPAGQRSSAGARTSMVSDSNVVRLRDDGAGVDARHHRCRCPLALLRVGRRVRLYASHPVHLTRRARSGARSRARAGAAARLTRPQ